MAKNPYDHEQDEHDYYYRESDKLLKYYAFLFKRLAGPTLLLILLTYCCSCASSIPLENHIVKETSHEILSDLAPLREKRKEASNV